MAQFLRFQLYADPSRQTYTQIHADIPVDTPVHFQYGEQVAVGEDTDDKANWPVYVVAHLPRIKREAVAGQPEKKHIIYEIFLARPEQWDDFEFPGKFMPIE